MPRTCPNCGRQAIDDQSQFCNKCGSPFPPEEQQKMVFVRTVPRVADTPPPQQQPLQPPQQPLQTRGGLPAGEPAAMSRPRVRVPAKKPVNRKSGRGEFLNFETFITRDFIRFIYIAGVIAIVLISLVGIISGFSAPAASSTGTGSAVNATASSQDPTTSLITWIMFLVFGNLFWRVLCEMSFILFVMNESLLSIKNSLAQGSDSLYDDETPGYDDGDSGEFVDCPRCGKMVAPSELRTCEHCGVQGCSNCIRMMGLVRKTLTCKDCYQRK